MSVLNEQLFLPSLRQQKEETLNWIKNGNLKIPTLVVWGKNDPSAVLENGLALFELIASSAPRAQMHIFNQAGHYAYREHPKDFVEVVTAFIRAS
jgi:pimeloyl-ACP methyl ester carboxylesterase